MCCVLRTAALINPLPPLGVAVEVRPAVLEATDVLISMAIAPLTLFRYILYSIYSEHEFVIEAVQSRLALHRFPTSALASTFWLHLFHNISF